MEQLTDRQSQILSFISKRIQEQGYPPTIREIGQEMGIRSTNGVNDHLKALERKGALIRDGLKSRALRPVEMPNHDEQVERYDHVDHAKVVARIGPSITNDTVEVPLLGRVAAGAPILADEHVESTVHVDSFFLGKRRGKKVFALRVTGESMIEAGIHDGDYIFVRKQIEANRGDIVVAMIDGEATVKTYDPRGDVIRLVPENKTMKAIEIRKKDFRQTSILGVVCGVYRKMDF